MLRHAPALVSALVLSLATGAVRAEDWPRWGGPNGDFSAPDPGLVETWGEGQPETLWRRPLGEGYSGISVVGGRLFTLFGEGEEEVVVALEASTGAEIWSYRYAAARFDGMRLGHGEGPHSTPTVAGGRVFAIGTTAILSVLDAEAGGLLWSLDLWAEFGSGRLRRGYGSSPLLHAGRLIVPLGGDGGVVAFDPVDGELLWRQPSVASAQSSPFIVKRGDIELIVLFAQDELVALEPVGGRILWRISHDSFGPYSISTPVVGSDGLLFVSSSYGGGARGVEVYSSGGVPRARSIWTSSRLSIHFTNALRIGDHVYGSSGRGSVITTALDATTGELAWRSRDLGRANFLRVGERVLALEETGRLVLASLSPEGISILAQAQILEGRSWTAPTLVGEVLYVRDREEILALELPVR